MCLSSQCRVHGGFFSPQHYRQALGAKRVKVWSPWKPDLEYQDRCVRWVVWRTAEALDGADVKVADLCPPLLSLTALLLDISPVDACSIKSRHLLI